LRRHGRHEVRGGAEIERARPFERLLGEARRGAGLRTRRGKWAEKRGGAPRDKRGGHTQFTAAPSLSASCGLQPSSPLRLGLTSIFTPSSLAGALTLFSSPGPCCRRRRGRASQVPGRSARGPETAPTGRSARHLPPPRPNERACDTCRREARAR